MMCFLKHMKGNQTSVDIPWVRASHDDDDDVDAVDDAVDDDEMDGYLSDGARARVEASRVLVRVQHKGKSKSKRTDDAPGRLVRVDATRACETRDVAKEYERVIDALRARACAYGEAHEREVRETRVATRGLASVARALRAVLYSNRDDVDADRDAGEGDDADAVVALHRAVATVERLCAEASERVIRGEERDGAEIARAARATTELADARQTIERMRATAETQENETIKKLRAELCDAREMAKANARACERASSTRDIAKADAFELRRQLKALHDKCTRQEAQVSHAMRAAEGLKARAEAAESAAEHAQSCVMAATECEATKNFEIVDRARREVLDARASVSALETKLRESAEQLLELQKKRGPELERARLEGAQTFKTRVDSLSTQHADLERELEKKTHKIAHLEQEITRSRAAFDELKRGATYKVQSLERKIADDASTLEAMANEKRELTLACEDSSAKCAEISSRDASNAATLTKLEARVRALCEKANVAMGAVASMKARRKGDGMKITALKRKVESLRRAKSASRTFSSSLVADNEASLMRISLMEVQLRDAEKIIASANREWVGERQRRARAEQVSQHAMNELDTMRCRLHALESAREEADLANATTIASALETNVDAEAEICSLRAQIESLRSELSATSDALVSARDELATATTREQRLRWTTREMESVNAGLRRTVEEQATLISERDVIEADLARREEDLAAAEARAAHLDVELANTKIELRRARETSIKLSLELESSTPRAAAPPRPQSRSGTGEDDSLALIADIQEKVASPPTRSARSNDDKENQSAARVGAVAQQKVSSFSARRAPSAPLSPLNMR